MDDDNSMKCELYSMELDRWTALPDHKNGKYSHSMTSRANRYLYVFGGFDLLNDEDLNSIECLDLNHLDLGWQIIRLSGHVLPALGCTGLVPINSQNLCIFKD